MMKILIIYANSDAVMRSSVADLLYSFKKNLPDCEVYYHNAILNRTPLLPAYRRVDYVIFHHSVTTVWNRPRYEKKLHSWKRCNFYKAKIIALMQDEYKNIDLLRQFINELKVDQVFSLAPESQWPLLYGNGIVNRGALGQYLAGYIEASESELNFNNDERDIDIGYRADWTKMHVKLGEIGFLKRDIAINTEACAAENNIRTDIKVGGEHFIRGDDWGRFLQRCRYVIGVPSGSSVLDSTGCIEKNLLRRVQQDSNIAEKQLYQDEVSEYEGTLALEVLSPRHFEAMSYGCGQILIESDYNDIMQPWVHYLPLRRDFSNINEIIEMSKDENLRLKMVKKCTEDIVLSGKFSYAAFVQDVLPDMSSGIVYAPSKACFALRFNSLIESLKCQLISLRSLVSSFFGS